MQKLKRLIKLSIFVLMIFPALIFLGFVGAVSFIDFNRYKPQLEQKVTEMTQREFDIEGAIEVSVLPFTLSIGQSTLKSPEGFAEQPLLSFKELRVELSLLALFLDKQMEIQSLEWIEPKLVLIEQNEANNWSDLPGLAELVAFFSHADGGAQSAQANSWQLNSLVVQGGQIVWQPQTAKNAWNLKGLSVVANQLAMDKAFPIHLRFDWDSSHSQRHIELRLNGDAKLPAGWNRIGLVNWQGVLKLQRLNQTQYPLVNMIHQGKGLSYAWQKSELNLVSMETQALNGLIQWSANGRLSEEVKGQAIARNVDYGSWQNQLGLDWPEGFDDTGLTNQNAVFDWTYQNGEVAIDKVTKQAN